MLHSPHTSSLRPVSRSHARTAALGLLALLIGCGGASGDGVAAQTAAKAAANTGKTQDRAAAQLPVPTWPGGPLTADTRLTTTESGLRYAVLAPGKQTEDGVLDGPGSRFDTVEVHYTGWLTDGTKFDSSVDRGETATFPLSGVIAGWTEGLQLMPLGAKYVFVVPSELAYGERGRPPMIPGNADLVFEVELIAVPQRVELPDFVLPDAARCISTESGLQYEVLVEGTGDPVRTTDWVTMNYSLWLADGSPLHSTAMTGEPQQRPVTAMPVPGLSEGIQKMRQGGKSRFIVPPKLAYGDMGIEGLVPPGAEIICEVEVLAIERGPEPVPGPDFRLPADDELTTTASGLQYQIIEPGDGAMPGPNSTVTAHYAGWLTDGTLFDSSFERGEPTSFPLDRVIAGWTEGLQLMHAGGEALFVIPPALGYGAGGAGEVIPPNSTLVFAVRLQSVDG